MQVKFHHGEEGGNIFGFGIWMGIIELAELVIILLKEEYNIVEDILSGRV
jgi:hypothetical protein